MESEQEIGLQVTEHPTAMSSGRSAALNVLRQHRGRAADAVIVRNGSGQSDSGKPRIIRTPAVEVAVLKHRMATLFPELVRSQQHGQWCISKTVSLGDPAA